MSDIKVGKPQVRLDISSHVKGVSEGNQRGSYEKQAGHHDDGTADARRSTGIRPRKHDAVLSAMPNLPPG